MKEEQINRINTRDNLVYATLLSIAGVIAASIQANLPSMLLLLCPVCLIFGWTYLINDEKISAIGRYVRGSLAVRLAEQVGEPVLGWEGFHRSDRRRRSRKLGQLLVDLTTFVVPALGGLAGCWISSRGSGALLTASVLGLCSIGWLAHQIIRYADLDSDPPPDPA